jgi:hypothetical protein
LAGAVYIGIQQAHTGSFGGQRQRQIGSGGGFANTTFARRDSNDVFNMWYNTICA